MSSFFNFLIVPTQSEALSGTVQRFAALAATAPFSFSRETAVLLDDVGDLEFDPRFVDDMALAFSLIGSHPTGGGTSLLVGNIDFYIAFKVASPGRVDAISLSCFSSDALAAGFEETAAMLLAALQEAIGESVVLRGFSLLDSSSDWIDLVRKVHGESRP